LGCKITIATVHGPLNISVQPGTSSDDTIVLKHWGVPEFNPPDNYDEKELQGDHILTFKVLLPNVKNISKEYKNAIDELL
jgi:DnaJ-class molecular chaperone